LIAYFYNSLGFKFDVIGNFCNIDIRVRSYFKHEARGMCSVATGIQAYALRLHEAFY
jgi:hypothetical protein